MNQLKAGIIINYISIIIRLSSSFFLTPFIISSLGVDEYGLFMLSNTIIAWLALSDLGLGATMSRYITIFQENRESEKQKYFLGQAVVLFTMISIVTGAIGIICYTELDNIFPNLSPDQSETLHVLFLLTLGNMVFAFPVQPFSYIPGAYLKFFVPGVISLISSVINMFLTIIILMIGYKSIAITMASVAVNIITQIVGLLYVFKFLGVRVIFKKPDIHLYEELFRFSFWVMITQIMNILYWKAGAPIVARLAGATAVSTFTLGTSFANYMIAASTAISGVLAPKIMRMVAHNSSKEELTWFMIRSGRIQLILTGTILLSFFSFGADFLRLWVGGSIGDSTYTVWIGALVVMVPLILEVTQNVGGALLQAMNIHKGRALILFWTSIICALSGYFLTMMLGVIGMFIGTGASLLIGQGFLLNLYYHRKAGINMLFFWKETYYPIILPATILIIIGLTINKFHQSIDWQSLIINVIIYISICTLTLFLLYADQRERIFFIDPIRRFVKRQ